MVDPFTVLVRKIAVSRHASKVPTRIMPMSKVSKAAVFIDGAGADSNVARKLAQTYFASLNIPVLIIAPQAWDLNKFGWMKKSSVVEEWGEDFFLSLAESDNFASEYAARCSKAKFKVGRAKLPGNVFDIVVSNPENSLPRPHQVFNVIKDYLDRIQ